MSTSNVNRVQQARMDNRRENLRNLIQKNGGPKAFALAIDRPPSFISQIAGPNPTRPVTEDTARMIEAAIGIPVGSLDWPQGKRPMAVKVEASVSERDGEIVKMLAALCDVEKIKVPMMKFGEIAAYAISEAAVSGKLPDERALRRMVKKLL